MKAVPKSIGKVITFYSYKGGVGRSMGLANVAALLSKWGKRVLIVDFDLEAPGIENYFKKTAYHYTLKEKEYIINKKNIDFKFSKNRKDCPGILDILSSIANDETEISWKDSLISVSSVNHGVSIDIISAGRDSPEYSSKLQDLNWDYLFDEKDFTAKIESIRNEWKESYDFILIDSRTGISDIGGICTIYLPDTIACLFTTNEASLNGCIDVIELARNSRNKLPYDRSLLITIPIPSRNESQSEHETVEKWREIFEDRLEFLFSDWLPKGTSVKTAIDALKIPYKAYWSFGDRLPVLEEGTSEPIGRALEKIALLILGDFDWQKVKDGLTSEDIDTSQHILLLQERQKIEIEIEKKSKRKRTKVFQITLGFTIALLTVLYLAYNPYKEYRFLQQVELYPSIVKQYEAQGGDLDSIKKIVIDNNNFLFLKDKLDLFNNLDTIVLKEIKFDDFDFFSSPDDIRSLEISSCRFDNFSGIEKFASLQTLIVSDNYNLINLKGIEGLTTLTTLTITNNYSLDSLTGIEELNSLKSLTIAGSSSLRSLKGVEALTSLQSLSLGRNISLKSLHSVEQLSSLQSLKLNSGSIFGIADRDTLINHSLIDFNKLQKLKSLSISGNYSLKDLQFFESLQKLDTLIISNNDNINNLQQLAKLNQLKSLTLEGLRNLGDLRGIEVLDSLEYLDITNYNSTTRIGSLSTRSISRNISLYSIGKLEKLKTLFISGDYKFVDLKDLKNNRSLNVLVILDNNTIKSLTGIETIINLESFTISYCNNFSNLQGIEKLKKIKSLTILENKYIHDLHFLTQLSTLEKLAISNYHRLLDDEVFTKFPDWRNLNHLKALTISGSFDLTKLYGFQMLSSLDSLDISSNDSLTTLGGIGNLRSLRSLKMSDNINLIDLRGIEKLKSLLSLDLSYNDNLTNINGLEYLSSIKDLTIDGQEKIKFNFNSLSKLKGLKSLNISSDIEIDYKTLKRDLPKLKLTRISDE